MLLMGGSNGLSEVDPASALLFWNEELARATVVCEAAVGYRKVVEEQRAKSLQHAAALGLSVAGEPHTKRALAITSGKGKGKARDDTME